LIRTRPLNPIPNPVRIVFFGTAQLACTSLKALVGAPGLQVVGVVTQPDRPKGRDLKVQPSAVKELSRRAELAVLQPERVRSPDFTQELRVLQPDLVVVAAYGQILPQAVLDLPPWGCINVHTSLLPKYRGAAPIQWALLNDDAETGVTLMKVNAELDTGDILTQEKTSIRPDDNAETLHDRLAEMGAALLVRTIPSYIAGQIEPRPQLAEGACYARKITKEDGRIGWTNPARAIWNQVRGLVPWPGAFTFLSAQPRPHRLKIWQAEVADRSGPAGEILQADKAGLVVGCGSQALRILLLQREGGRRLTPEQFLAGHPLQPGQRLDATATL
jgi:methionyl-tRNA formyltransferase